MTAAEPLQHAVQALGSVQSRMVAAMGRAAYWRDEYAAHGMEGLGAGCEQIRAAAETIHNQAVALSGQIEDQAKIAGLVSDTMGPDQVVATLTPVGAELATLGAHCLAGVNRCEDLALLVNRNLEGGQPEWLAEQANRSAGDFRESKRDREAAAGIVADAIQRAREAGGSGASGTGTSAGIGDPLPDPDERLGAKIKNTERLKSRARPRVLPRVR